MHSVSVAAQKFPSCHPEFPSIRWLLLHSPVWDDLVIGTDPTSITGRKSQVKLELSIFPQERNSFGRFNSSRMCQKQKSLARPGSLAS